MQYIENQLIYGDVEIVYDVVRHLSPPNGDFCRTLELPRFGGQFIVFVS
jgi:hypothetical protein